MGNYIFLVLILSSFFGLSKLFEKAGLEKWKGWIPFYNFYCLSKLLGKPWWWTLIMVVPGVNILMYGVYGFNVARAFNKPSTSDLLFASLLPYVFFVKTGLDPTAKFVGLERYKTEPIKFIKNWIDPIVFAVIAASIIRGFFIEAFTIPTSSLEKSLMVGDFLFVNKFAYGPKIPQTPLSFPFAHHTLPFSSTRKSYLEWIKLPYLRLPGFGHVRNNDIVVFNYPDGDTVLLSEQMISYYALKRYFAQIIQNEEMRSGQKIQSDNYYATKADEWIHNENAVNPINGLRIDKVVARPVDKRDHYVKRCVGIAGDNFEIKEGEIFINDRKQAMPEKAQHKYYVKCRSKVFGEGITTAKGHSSLSNSSSLDALDIYVTEASVAAEAKDTIVYNLNMPVETVEKVKRIPDVLSVTKIIDPKGSRDENIFPHSSAYAWNNDNFGPLQIPKAGQTILIDTHNVCLYQKIMDTYDDGIHQITKSGAQVLFDGKPINSYTFKQDYYFMVGDNRQNSADSRSWGFVPFDHIVGSPFFVWFSMKYEENNPVSGKSVIKSLTKNSTQGKFRWERFLCYADDGTLHSVKIPFVLIILAIWGFSRWNTRRKKSLLN